MKKIKKHFLNSVIMIGILAFSFAFSILLQEVLDIREHIATVFVFAVFLVSIITEGYFYGILTAVLGVLAVNFAFTFPYFSLNFKIPENFLSAIIMIVLSLITSALTTKLKKWQEIKAEGEREKMKANLMRAVSHDIRTPLTTIYGSSSAMLDNYDILSDESKQKMITGIRDDSQWLIGMVENLLSITKIDGGNIKLIKSPTVLEELVDSVIIKFKKRYPNIKIEIEIPDDVLIIPMDPILIEQVIINILENAVYHAIGMTRLIFRVYLDGGNAIFEIVDDGCGIDKERLPKIFIGHNSTHYATDSKRRNAGIGLSVCQSIIKAHGGSISARNGENGGAIFTFTLNTSTIEVFKEEREKYYE